MRRFTQIIVLAGLSAAVLTSNAAAQDFRSPDARVAGPSTTRVIDLRSPDARDAARAQHRSDVAQTAALTDLRSPDARDVSGVQTYEPGVVPETTRVVQIHTGTFQWSDAGIGAAGMLGLIALCGGVLLLISSHRRERRLPPAIG